jgi:hypothetical protein
VREVEGAQSVREETRCDHEKTEKSQRPTAEPNALKAHSCGGQVMAMATLAEVYNNHGVFTGVVKIRRGLSARIATEVRPHTPG